MLDVDSGLVYTMISAHSWQVQLQKTILTPNACIGCNPGEVKYLIKVFISFIPPYYDHRKCGL